jgi:beta-glucosidase
MKGKEIVQLYIRPIESEVVRPEKELKRFEKLDLASGEKKEVSFTLNSRDFAYYSTNLCDWYVQPGEYEMLIGVSCADIRLKGRCRLGGQPGQAQIKLSSNITTQL